MFYRSGIKLKKLLITTWYQSVIIYLAITCGKPNINHASISPSTDPIAYDAEYTVSCNTGFKISGGMKMKCEASGFDQTPSCTGKHCK